MKRIRYLKGFRYFEVRGNDQTNPFALTAEASPRYFKSEVLNKENILWNGKPITLPEDPLRAPPFDSGIVCSLSTNLDRKRDTIDGLNCFFAPYQLMAETIKRLNIHEKRSGEIHRNSIAVGIGMVLSIIAKKGSSETGIQKPYMLFVNRGADLGVRSGELDVPVVEGLNCGDFTYDGQRYTAQLEAIAKRALCEERGLNCEMLESMGLLHMPRKYYLGYDKDYMQWNFFGTVVVDCTIEEIVREGFYYTKDKFESSRVIAIPAEPQILYYHLSEKTLQKKREGGTPAKRFWNTAWASVSFALRDYAAFYDAEEMCNSFEEKWFLMEKSVPSLIEPARKAVNLAARWFEKHRKLIEIGSGFFSVVAIVLFLLSAVKQESHADTVNEISSLLMAVLTCWLAISLARRERISADGIVEIELNTATDGYLIPEIRVFRHVVLLDGHIGKEGKNISIKYQRASQSKDKSQRKNEVKVERECKMFADASMPNIMWEMLPSDTQGEENIQWVIKNDPQTQESLRVVFPCIVRRRAVVFHKIGDKLSHGVDFEIPYGVFAAAEDAETLIKEKILTAWEKQLGHGGVPVETVEYKFLMKDRGQFVLSGYVYLDKACTCGEEYPLCSDLTNTSFSVEMKDDVTRVSCEYAIAEHMGYRMCD